jgi:hypothetical protein
MKSSRLNEWLQILASLGVLIGLVVVAYEIKQNTETAQAEFYRESYSMWMHVSTVEIETDIDEILVKSITNPESLSPGELVELSAYFVLVMSIYDNGARAKELGIATPTSLIRELDARYYFSSEISRQWFEANKNWMRPENVEIISRVIHSTPATTKWEQVEEMLFKSSP